MGGGIGPKLHVFHDGEIITKDKKFLKALGVRTFLPNKKMNLSEIISNLVSTYDVTPENADTMFTYARVAYEHNPFNGYTVEVSCLDQDVQKEFMDPDTTCVETPVDATQYRMIPRSDSYKC